MTSKIENRKSILLNDEQNFSIFNLLGPKCLTLSTTMTVVSVTIPPDHEKWKMRCTGVACFVKDYQRRTFMIRLYELDGQRLLWEVNLCDASEYYEVNPLYHVLKLVENGSVGFNFTNEGEAAHFAERVREKLQIRIRKFNDNPEASRLSLYPSLDSLDGIGKIEILDRKPMIPVAQSLVPNPVPKPPLNPTTIPTITRPAPKPPTQPKKAITKGDIGVPYNFQHLYHIGWSGQTETFEATRNVLQNEALQQLLASKGITPDQMNDKDTLKFIYDYLDKNGGLDKTIEVAPSSDEKRKSALRPAPPPPPKLLKQRVNSQTDDEKTAILMKDLLISSEKSADKTLDKTADKTPPPPIPSHQTIPKRLISDEDDDDTLSDYAIPPPTPPSRGSSKFYNYDLLLEEISQVATDKQSDKNENPYTVEPTVKSDSNLPRPEITKPTSPPPRPPPPQNFLSSKSSESLEEVEDKDEDDEAIYCEIQIEPSKSFDNLSEPFINDVTSDTSIIKPTSPQPQPPTAQILSESFENEENVEENEKQNEKICVEVQNVEDHELSESFKIPETEAILEFNSVLEDKIVEKPIPVPIAAVRKNPPIPAPRRNVGKVNRDSIYQNVAELELDKQNLIVVSESELKMQN